jgi:predicted alpha/beta-hydrolase family hydrolase
MRPILSAVSATLLLSLSLQVSADEFIVSSAHGGKVSVIAEFPDGPGPHPTLVLAPGQGYHMRLPVLEETGKALVRSGIAVFRFDWAYFTAAPRGRPSEGLTKELQDVEAVISAARGHAKVDRRRMAIGGKSLGSGVAWRAFVADDSLRSAFLLTPVCSRVPAGQSVPKPEADENYPGFSGQQRPILLISGDSDPLCATQTLLRFAAGGSPKARVAIVGGDHSFESRGLEPSAAQAARSRDLAAVAAVAASFVPATVSDDSNVR